MESKDSSTIHMHPQKKSCRATFCFLVLRMKKNSVYNFQHTLSLSCTPVQSYEIWYTLPLSCTPVQSYDIWYTHFHFRAHQCRASQCVRKVGSATKESTTWRQEEAAFINPVWNNRDRATPQAQSSRSIVSNPIACLISDFDQNFYDCSMLAGRPRMP